jgi:hypothetical protein
VVGTPDDLVAAIRNLQELTGGFGVVLGFAHDWANREATLRSWDLVARYVVPEVNGLTVRLRESQQFLHDHQAELMAGAGKAVMSKIMAHQGAAVGRLYAGPSGPTLDPDDVRAAAPRRGRRAGATSGAHRPFGTCRAVDSPIRSPVRGPHHRS